MLDERKAIVLGALIEEYIRCGEPISSGTVLEVSGLSVSPATVRNDLAYLEREGFAAQPHTSAGRIPTAKGYRWYVDHAEPNALRRPTRVRIQDFFNTVHLELGRLLKATSELVSDVTSYPSIVLGPVMGSDQIRGVHVVSMGPRSLLVVLVSNQGKVTQELIHLDDEVDDETIEDAERRLNDLLVDRKIDDADSALPDALAGATPAECGVIVAAVEAARDAQAGTRDIYVGGTSRLAGVWEDLASVHRVLEVLEREAMLLSILASVEDGTIVRIGEELPIEGGTDLAVVSARYELSGRTGGTIGVLGPMRMDYRRTKAVIEEVRDNLGERLGS